jgi:hypothetical protein
VCLSEFHAVPAGSATQDTEQKLTAGDGAAEGWFGYAVSISGDYALVGAHGDADNGDSSGSAYVYRIEDTNGTATDSQSGSAAGCMFNGHAAPDSSLPLLLLLTVFCLAIRAMPRN